MTRGVAPGTSMGGGGIGVRPVNDDEDCGAVSSSGVDATVSELAGIT